MFTFLADECFVAKTDSTADLLTVKLSHYFPSGLCNSVRLQDTRVTENLWLPNLRVSSFFYRRIDVYLSRSSLITPTWQTDDWRRPQSNDDTQTEGEAGHDLDHSCRKSDIYVFTACVYPVSINIQHNDTYRFKGLKSWVLEELQTRQNRVLTAS